MRRAPEPWHYLKLFLGWWTVHLCAYFHEHGPPGEAESGSIEVTMNEKEREDG